MVYFTAKQARKLIDESGLTNQELADMYEISPAMVSRVCMQGVKRRGKSYDMLTNLKTGPVSPELVPEKTPMPPKSAKPHISSKTRLIRTILKLDEISLEKRMEILDAVTEDWD